MASTNMHASYRKQSINPKTIQTMKCSRTNLSQNKASRARCISTIDCVTTSLTIVSYNNHRNHSHTRHTQRITSLPCSCTRPDQCVKNRDNFKTNKSRRDVVAYAESESNSGSGGVVSRMREKKGMQPTTPQAWAEMRRDLLAAGVSTITPEEARQKQQEEGYTILDIRTNPEYEQAHAAGAVSAPLYRPITNWDFRSVARRAAFAFFGVFNGTEESPLFLADASECLKGVKSKVIVYCGIGGSMTPTTNLAQGMQSRSLIACSELIMDGYTDVLHMQDGIYGWDKAKLPLEPEDE